MKKSPAIDELYTTIKPLTPSQSSDFNSRITSLSAYITMHVYEKTLPVFLTAEYLIEKGIEPASVEQKLKNYNHNWQLLLNHIYGTLLPEVYVFFHDDSCFSDQRQEAHHLLDMLMRRFRRWNKYSPAQLHMMLNNRPEINRLMNDYSIGKGCYANIASSMLPLAKHSRINGVKYIDQLTELVQSILNEDGLCRFLSDQPQEIIYQLDDWLDKRINNFSQPDNRVLQNQAQLLSNELHPLIKHMQHNYLQADKTTSSNKQDFGVQNYRVGMDPVTPDQVGTINKKGNKLKVQDRSMDTEDNGMILLKTVGVMVTLVLMLLGVLALLYRFSPFDVEVLLGAGASGIVCVAILSIFFWLRQRDKLKIAKQQAELYSIKSTKLNDNNNEVVSKDRISNIDADVNLMPVILPVSKSRHATHLIKILSEPSLELLDKLINAVNQTYDHLEYLQEHHPYLANSVHELIVDISTNTVNRLNQQAQNFVKQGKVEDSVKAMFAKQHEANIYKLLDNHLVKITALNESILAKQMTGFGSMGGDSERQFRDTVIELKILLSWFVAQADESIVCGYGMMKKKLESEMLVKMEDVYYKHDTNSEQKNELHRQVKELLAYFKEQSPKIAHSLPDDDLLRLTDGNTFNQSETQSFIDFNKQYVKQIKKYW